MITLDALLEKARRTSALALADAQEVLVYHDEGRALFTLVDGTLEWVSGNEMTPPPQVVEAVAAYSEGQLDGWKWREVLK